MIHDPNHWPSAGNPFRFTIEVLPETEGVLEQIEVHSGEDPTTGQAYWQQVWVPAGQTLLPAGVPHRFDVEVVGNMLHQPLSVMFRFEGRRAGREFLLLPYTPGTTQLVDTALVQGAQVGLGHARRGLVAQQVRRLPGREEVGPEAIVLHQEGTAVVEAPVELHHRHALAQAVGGLDDQAVGRGQGGLRCQANAATRPATFR